MLLSRLCQDKIQKKALAYICILPKDTVTPTKKNNWMTTNWRESPISWFFLNSNFSIL